MNIAAPLQLTAVLSPAEKDRWMQIWLAQARGKVRNGELLRAAYARAVQQIAIREGREVTAFMFDPVIETLKFLADQLEALGISYAVTGSLASSVHSEPAQTMDGDVLVIALPSKAAVLSELLAPRFYAPQDMLVNAAQSGGFLNVIDGQTGIKIDLTFVVDDAYLRECVGRRVRDRIGASDREFWFVTAEDIVLMKLLWRKDTKSAKQWENALGVAKHKGARMDWKYLFEQARALGVEQDLIKLRDEAGI